MAAEGLALQSSTTTAAFSIRVVSSARIADDWNSVCFSIHPTEARYHVKPIPYGFFDFGLATWTDKLEDVAANVELQTGQFLSMDPRRWQLSDKDSDNGTKGDKDDTATTAWQLSSPRHNPAVAEDAAHKDWPPLPSDGLGAQRELIPDEGGGNQTHSTGAGPSSTWHRWSFQGLVQQVCTPDKIDQWGGPTDIDRSQVTSFTLLMHKRHRDGTLLAHNDDAVCPIDECKRTSGVMKLINMAKNLTAMDIDQLTAHGAQPHLRDKWAPQGLEDHPNVVNFNTKAHIPLAAYNMYRVAVQVVVSLFEEIPTVVDALAELDIILDSSNLERVDCTRKEEVNKLRKSLIARISEKGPNIGYSFLINGAPGTLPLVVEVLQPDSPLLADILIALAQISLGSQWRFVKGGGVKGGRGNHELGFVAWSGSRKGGERKRNPVPHLRGLISHSHPRMAPHEQEIMFGVHFEIYDHTKK